MNETRDRSDVVLITGSGGFIGRALAARLSARFTIVGLDVAEGKDEHLAETVKVDLTSDRDVRDALAKVRRQFGARIASAIHLAAYYDLSGQPNPKYDSITVEGTRRLLRALRDGFEVGQFVFASTLLVHAPSEPGKRIDENWPLEPKWAYPASKAKTEELLRMERGDIPLVILRMAGVYDERCRAAFLAQQIARVYERQPLGYLFAGDPSRGQPYLHLEDLADAVERIVSRRDRLPDECTLLLGEEETPSYEALQRRIGELIHGEPWPVYSVPKPIAQGAWVQEDVLDEDSFVKPWMVAIADDHYELDIGRARELLDWSPQRSLTATLPIMIEALKSDPAGWYKDNKLNPALVAAVDAELREAPLPSGPAIGAAQETLEAEHGRALWAHLVNLALGAWLVASPFAYGLFEAVGPLPSPPAAGHELADPEIRNARLAWSEIVSGFAVMTLTAAAMTRSRSWARWGCAAVGLWTLFAPLVFWTTSAAAYAADTLAGTFVIVFSVMIPPPPGIAPEAHASASDLPLGWSYSPSSYVQRVPIVALAFGGLFISRYLAAFQLGHVEEAWDPFFRDGAAGMNGTEAVITSSVSKGFPIADAGFGAIAYILDILTGAMGDQRRWRTMPWLVLVFGLLIVPLGAVSIGFIIIQPTVIGALCTLCLMQAAITVVLIPFSVDEVLATCQFLLQARRAGRPFWRTLFRGGAGFSEERDRMQGLDMPLTQFTREFVAGGVTYPWTLAASLAVGVFLLTTPLTLAVAHPLYFSDHIVGCLVITVAVTALGEVTRAVRFLNIPLGLWVAASPLLFAGGEGLSSTIHVSLGLGLAALSLPRGRRTNEHYGGWDRYIV